MKVRTYSSFAYAVEPQAFEHDGIAHRVQGITRAWRTPGQIHFYVRDEPGDFFELTYDESKDEWTVRAFGKTCPPRKDPNG